MLEHFGNKQFMRFQTQGFEKYPLNKAYAIEEEEFLNPVKVISKFEIPKGANVVNSHVLYKIKTKEGGMLKLKSRIATHGNEDDMKNVLSTDCTTCSPTGIRIVESTASLYGWKVTDADFKAAFIQTGDAMGDVYVKPP